MKTKISVFITTIALFFGVTTASAQGTNVYFKKGGTTVFQSPVADIDSIIFKKTGYVLNDVAKEIGNEWESHISGAVTDSVITLSSNDGLTLPKVGEILIKPKITEKFPYGFLGKVIEVKQAGGGVKIVTESVPLDEAFEELSTNETIDMVDNISMITDGDGKTVLFTKSQSSQLRASIQKTVNFGVNAKFGETAALTGSIEMGLKLDFNMNIRRFNLEYFKMALTPAFTANLKLTSELNGEYANAICVAIIYLVPITAGPIVINPVLTVYAGVDAAGKISLSVEATYNSSHTFGCYYDGNNWYSIDSDGNNSSGNRSPLKGTFSMDGRIGIGPTLELRFMFYNQKNLSAAIKGKVLLAFTSKFEWDTDKAASGVLYELLGGVKGKLSIPVEGEASVTISLFKFLKIEPKFTQNTEIVLAEFPLLPNITNLKVTDGSLSKEKVVSYILTDDVLFPGRFGMKLYDEYNTLLETDYYNDIPSYIDFLSTTAPAFTFSNLTAQKTYTARPVFSLFGLLEIVEKQSIEVKVEDDNCAAFDNPDGVVINGVRWATRNVGAPGTFVSSPCDYGEYYQFNKGTTNFLLWDDYWNSVYSKSDSWLPANDPSPAGWRVPTLAEIQSLFNTTYVSNEWINLNGVNGRKFTDKASGNSIFLPAAGYRYGNDGTLYSAGSYGYYWSSTVGGSYYAYGLNFGSYYAYWSNWYDRSDGRSVRAVAE